MQTYCIIFFKLKKTIKADNLVFSSVFVSSNVYLYKTYTFISITQNTLNNISPKTQFSGLYSELEMFL